jgi:NTE family protein
MDASTPTLAQALAGRRVGVVLSSGFFGFYAHAGFFTALDGAGLRPAGYAGTSAGALVAALAAAGLGPEEISSRLLSLQRSDFWDPAPIAWLLDAVRGRIPTGFLSGRRFRKLLRQALPVERNEATATPLVLVTTDVTHARRQVHVEGDLVEAIFASCAYPGLFRPVGQGAARLWDGGLIDKAPLQALVEQVEVDALLVHYLPSRSRVDLPRREPGYLGALGRAMAAGRHHAFELQGQLCEAMGLPVYVVAPTVEAVSPGKLGKGRDVIGHAADWAARVFAEPAAASRPFG